jgi:aspartate/methionine/tyrosine aminotransferase
VTSTLAIGGPGFSASGQFPAGSIEVVDDTNPADVADYIRKSAGISVSDGRMYGPSGDGFLRIVYGAVGSDAHFEESVTSLAFVLRRFAATPRSV